MRIVWSRRSLRDLQEIRRHIAADHPAAAQRMANRIVAAVRRLSVYPHLGRPGREPGTRELAIAGTPYVVPYTAGGDTVRVTAVLHGAQQWPEQPGFDAGS
jgi:toxin ParE1/3/4